MLRSSAVQNKTIRKKESALSRLGVSASLACAVHCAVMPLFLAIMPVSAEYSFFPGFHEFEPFLIGGGALLSALLLLQARNRNRFLPLRYALLLGGISVFFAGYFSEIPVYHSIISFAGALLMAVSQYNPLFRVHVCDNHS